MLADTNGQLLAVPSTADGFHWFYRSKFVTDVFPYLYQRGATLQIGEAYWSYNLDSSKTYLVRLSINDTVVKEDVTLEKIGTVGLRIRNLTTSFQFPNETSFSNPLTLTWEMKSIANVTPDSVALAGVASVRCVPFATNEMP